MSCKVPVIYIVPNNKLIRIGVLVVAGSALLWLGAVVLSRLKDMFLYIGIVGVVLILLGIFLELKKTKDEKAGQATGTPPEAS